MKRIFADYQILKLERDPTERDPGVFLKAKKPTNFVEVDLGDHRLHRVRKPPWIIWLGRQILRRYV